ncbi:MAG: hypothetical protein GY849_04170, partial [Deltaproteobacteria bacterium]|nr:hypothetical protein [Deltaproteobacteria bacterium]
MQDSPHSITLDRTMDVIIPYLPEILVPRPCLSRMMAYAQTLPASLTHFFIFETRLSPKLDHADFALYPTREEGLTLLAHGPLGSDRHDRYYQDQAWERIQSFCQSCLDKNSPLHENIEYLWLEFDIDPEGKDLKTPGLFFGFERDRLKTTPGHDPLKHQRATDSGRFFHEALGMLLS